MAVAGSPQLQVLDRPLAQRIPPLVPKQSVRGVPRDRPRLAYKEYLLGLCRMIDTEDEPAELLRHRKWLTCLRFAEGRQLGYINARTGLWTDVVKEDGDPIYISNVLGYFISALITADSQSQVVYDVAALSSRFEAIGAARLAGEIIQYIRRHTWKATEQQRESKFSVICGNSFRRTRLSRNPRVKLPVPRFAEKQIQVGGGSFQCSNPDCLQGGEVGELQTADQGVACPACGDTSPTIHDQLTVPVQVIDGFDELPAIEVKTSVIDPFEIKAHLHARSLDESPWLRWSVLAYRRTVEAQYEWAQLDALSGTPRNLALLYQREMERSPGNIASQIDLAQGHAGSFDGLTQFDNYWIEPWFYAGDRLDYDEELGDERTIPAGTRYLDLFPSGMGLTRCGGCILNAYDADKKDEWGHRRWDLMPDQLYARGIEDMIQSSKQRNEIKSLLYEILLKHASPRTLYNPLKFRRTDLQSRPGWAAPMKNPGLQDDPGNFVHVQEPVEAGPGVTAFLEETKRDMQLEGGGAFSPQPGMPDADNPTARGKIIMRDAAVALLIPKLNLKAELEVANAEQHLRLVHRYDLVTYYAGRLTEYADYEVEAFKKLTPDADLIVTARAGSQMPISEDDRRNDLNLALGMGQLPGGIFNEAIPENVRQMAMERLNLPLETDKQSPDERKQAIEIRHLQIWAEVATQQGLDLETAAMIALAGTPQANGQPGQPPIAPVLFMVENHQVHVERIKRFFNTDAGLKASPLLQRLLMDHLKQHLQGALMYEQQMSMLQVAAQAPALQMAAAADPAAQGSPSGDSRKGSSDAPQSARGGAPLGRGQAGGMSTAVNRQGQFGGGARM